MYLHAIDSTGLAPTGGSGFIQGSIINANNPAPPVGRSAYTIKVRTLCPACILGSRNILTSSSMCYIAFLHQLPNNHGPDRTLLSDYSPQIKPKVVGQNYIAMVPTSQTDANANIQKQRQMRVGRPSLFHMPLLLSTQHNE